MTRHDPDHDTLSRLLRDVPREGPDPAFVEALGARLRHAHHARARRSWRWSLPLTTGAFAAAALLLLMLLPTAGVGFADMRQSLRAVRTMAFSARLMSDSPRVPADLLVVHTALDRGVGVRSVAEVLGVPVVESVALRDGGAWIANRLSDQWAEGETGQGIERWLRELDPARLLLDIQNHPGVVATRLDDGTTPQDFRFSLRGGPLDLPEGASVVVRADRATRLPLQIVYELPPTPQGRVRVVIDGFVWNDPVDSATFRAPESRHWTRVDSPDHLFAPISEGTLMSALSDFAAVSGGRYPGHRKAETPMLALLLAARDPSLAAMAGADVPADLLERLILGGLYVAHLAQVGKQPSYHGDRVTADMPDETLLQWRTDEGAVRRITGDLSADTLEPGATPR